MAMSKSSRGWIVLSTAVVLVCGYAVYDYQSEKRDNENKAQASVLITLDKDQINEFSVVRPEAKVVLHKDEEGWKLDDPKELADQNTASDFVEGATLEKSIDVAKSGEGIDWKIFGLDQPQASIQFKDNAGHTQVIDVANKKNFAGEWYLARTINGTKENKVYTGNNSWPERAKRKTFDFRDKRILRTPAPYATEVRLFKNGKQDLLIEKKDAVWMAPAQAQWILDQTKTNEIPFMLNNLQITEFVKDPVDKNGLAEYGLNKPMFSFVLKLKDMDDWRVDFVQSKEKDYYAWTSKPARVVKVSAAEVAKFAALNLENLRDRHLAFQFNKPEVASAHINNGIGQADVSHDPNKSEAWKVDKVDTGMQVPVERIPAFMTALASLEIADFEPQSSVPANLAVTVELKDVLGKSLLQMQLGSSYSKKVDGNVHEYILVKTSLYPQSVGIDALAIKKLDLAGLVRSQSANLENKAPTQPAKEEAR